MLNKVILMGRLTRDPELRHTQSGVPVASFTLAVDRGFQTNGQSVDFINIVAWRNTAEFVVKWFTKGQLVAVSGKLQVRAYKDRDGNNRTATEVVADEVFFAEGKREGDTSSTASGPPLNENLAESLLFAKDGETADNAKLFARGGNEQKGEERRGEGFEGELPNFKVSEWGEITEEDTEPLPF